ncbi:MAG: PSP1 domain-containing protein, partial [Phycisphaeraceae bacterium]
MPGTITPLPVMMEEEEIEREKQELLKKQPPESIVVRYSYQKKLIELKYEGETTPGCGTKFVIRSPRGIELGEMVTTVCPNGGCGHAVTRKQMRTYIDKSGGRDFPFTTDGRILREAAREDELEQQRLDELKPEWIAKCKALIDELSLDMKLVDVEPLLGGERVVFYYLAENYVDFRELVKRLGSDLQTRVEMVQLNAREEARIVADYEKCGQHCCCKQFLKVLKPVSMRAAKVQKATLDPSKISGRCGRLMCCLRYEDKTYSELKKNLPHRKTIVETPDGTGTVLDGQILTQLVLVKIPGSPQANAYPVEDIRPLDKEEVKQWKEQQAEQQREAEERWKKRQERKDQRGGSPSKSSQPKAEEKPSERDSS